MGVLFPTRRGMKRGAILALAAAMAPAAGVAAAGQTQPAGPSSTAPAPTAPASTVLDRVVAVVNNQAILWSDIANEVRFSVLDPESTINATLSPQTAVQELISRTLIQQQVRQEDITASQPNPEEVQARLKELRTELPACVRMNCATETGWQKFLSSNGLTASQVEAYLGLRLEMIRFIEIRFRQGIRIAQQDIETYYRTKLVPQYAPGARVPPLSDVAPRIEEILLEQQVNVLFDAWLDNLRKQGNVEILDPALETGSKSASGKDAVK
jgi:peptidyl-prolyl cis-trans isomerase SurA